MKKKLLLLGWDAADWQIINPLLDSGRMPALSKLIDKGVMGNIATLNPPLSPMLWTSIATGKRAYDHGILNFTEPDLNNNYIRPVYSSSRKVKAIWEILSEKNIKSNIVSWWPSHPAEKINGVSVSNLFVKVQPDKNGEKNFPAEGVFPENFTERFKELHLSGNEISIPMLKAFVPNLKKLEEKHIKPISTLAKIIAETATTHAIATSIMQNDEWEFMAVYFDAIDHFCHAFMKFYPPKQDFIPEDAFEIFKDIIPLAYHFHDMMLERYMQLAGDDCTILLLSDHGFKSDEKRNKFLPKEPAAPAYDHREYGIFVMSGPETKKDERIYGSTLLDITPTILQHFNLPVGRDMEGRVLSEVFAEPKAVAFIDSYENKSADNTSVKKEYSDPLADQLALNQLAELGYIEQEEDKKLAVKKTTDEMLYNLARAYMDGGKYAEAEGFLNALVTENPDTARFTLSYFNCLLILRRFEKAKIVLDSITAQKFPYLNLSLYKAELSFAQNKINTALEYYKEALQLQTANSSICLNIGKCYFKLSDYENAASFFLRALSIDGNNPVYYYHLAKLYFKLERYEEAAAICLESVVLRYHFPAVHLILGRSLFQLENYKEATSAYEVFLRMCPSHLKARQTLIEIYQKLNDEMQAANHQQFLDENDDEWIYIVSGLPRSGTSMMMQALNAGGMNLMYDDLRHADKNNPHGYFEYEPVKRLNSHNGWIKDIKGKVIKVIAQQLKFLPSTNRYKIIFMERNLEEVLKSQDVMLGKENTAATYNTIIATSFKNTLSQIEELKQRPEFEFLNISYTEIINDPLSGFLQIEEFFDQDLDIDKMKEAVKPELYRNKLP